MALSDSMLDVVDVIEEGLWSSPGDEGQWDRLVLLLQASACYQVRSPANPPHLEAAHQRLGAAIRRLDVSEVAAEFERVKEVAAECRGER